MQRDNLKELLKISTKAIEELTAQINIFTGVVDQAVKSVPEEFKGDIAEAKAVTTKAINLAKMGKAEEAQAVLTDFQKRKNAG